MRFLCSARLRPVCRPVVAAGVFYLILTIPLTHLVNFVDNRLRQGRSTSETENPLDPIASTTSQEIT